MVIEIDPEGTLDPSLGVAKRIPETGRLAVQVREIRVFDLTVIPFLWSADPDRAVVETAEAMDADPEGHELLWDTRTLLPIGDLEVTAHEPVLSSSNNAFALVRETEAIQAIEGGRGHYMSMMSGPVTGGVAGLANRPGRASFSIPNASAMAHELGHNLNLGHAPCGGAVRPDRLFPYPDGSTGAWGYDFRDDGRLVGPSTPDLMSYCNPKWISDYHFANALRFRLFDEGPPQVAARSLLLWGGMDAKASPFSTPPSWLTPQPRFPIPLVRTGLPDGPAVAVSSSPSVSPCPRWPMATGARPSPSSSQRDPTGPATWQASHSPGQTARLHWTATPIFPWPSCSIRAPDR